MDELTALALRARDDGGDAAVAAFVRAATPGVWRLCGHLVDRGRADDLTQETLLRALRALPAFRGDCSARTWLLGIARRTCVDELRRLQRRRRLQERLVALTPGDVAPTGREHLEELLAGLDADRREAFVLTQVLGCSYAEAAAVCGVPVGTIRSRVARGRADLLEAVRRSDAV